MSEKTQISEGHFVLVRDGDESIFKSKEAKEKPCEIDEASMEKDEGAEVRR